MTVAVNAPLVTLRQSKPAFQIQVVTRPIAAIAASEQARLETGHDAPHLLTDSFPFHFVKRLVEISDVNPELSVTASDQISAGKLIEAYG